MPKKGSIIEGVEIVDLGAKGKVIGKKEGQVYLSKDAVPGDTINLKVKRNRKGYVEGVVDQIVTYSDLRVEARCAHFQHCGGCNWQNLGYKDQLKFKEAQVAQQLKRLGGFETHETIEILGSEKEYQYRNKLEFTFSKEGWLTPEQIKNPDIVKAPALGFHVPGRFDWVMKIDECHLQDPLQNQIRNFTYTTAIEMNLRFYQPREKVGLLRNLVLRNNRKGEWMVLLIVTEDNEDVRTLCSSILEQFSEIKSMWLVINQKLNDSYNDCPVIKVSGEDHLIETFTNTSAGIDIHYKIGPKSFFQTNSGQAERLYQLVYDWAQIAADDLVYDLYTGTGTIALFVAAAAKEVVGIEYVPEAIEDAKINADLNSQSNMKFYAGDMKDILTAEFISQHGKPDVLITDPPRAGMHADVVERILQAEPKRIVYVSCDPATQARDMKMLSEKYDLQRSQAVDMFPHTSHVENIALMTLR